MRREELVFVIFAHPYSGKQWKKQSELWIWMIFNSSGGTGCTAVETLTQPQNQSYMLWDQTTHTGTNYFQEDKGTAWYSGFSNLVWKFSVVEL